MPMPWPIACCTVVLLLSACVSPAPRGTAARMKSEVRSETMQSCLRAPERYGFSYTRRQVVELSMHAPSVIDTLYGHCAAVARVAAR